MDIYSTTSENHLLKSYCIHVFYLLVNASKVVNIHQFTSFWTKFILWVFHALTAIEGFFRNYELICDSAEEMVKLTSIKMLLDKI